MRHKAGKRIWYCDNCGGGYICEACHKRFIDAAVLAERDGNEYWGMNQELTEQIATLRGELDNAAEVVTLMARDMHTLREALENEWRIAHNDYCGCSLDGRMKCDHPKPKALATEAPQ